MNIVGQNLSRKVSKLYKLKADRRDREIDVTIRREKVEPIKNAKKESPNKDEKADDFDLIQDFRFHGNIENHIQKLFREKQKLFALNHKEKPLTTFHKFFDEIISKNMGLDLGLDKQSNMERLKQEIISRFKGKAEAKNDILAEQGLLSQKKQKQDKETKMREIMEQRNWALMSEGGRRLQSLL